MDNSFIHYNEWESLRIKALSWNFRFGLPEITYERVEYWMGRPVIYVEDGVIIWECCQYCRSTETPMKGLFGEIVCSCCGAPIGRCPEGRLVKA